MKETVTTEEIGACMSENGIRMARFDHVSEKGDLVFVCDHRHFAVPVDDALDHAILEAKQVKEEEEGTPRPQAAAPLPVSSIQAAIRAGARPANVAQQFAVNEALVRRFAAPVETEKKYAIEQFLTMQAPKGSAGHTNQDLIARVLRQAGATMKNLIWEATRQGYEPWKISGVIQIDKRIVNAQWAWNMHDNTVTCLNDAARTLLDQSNLADLLGDMASPAPPKQAEPCRTDELKPLPAQPETTGTGQGSFQGEQTRPEYDPAPIRTSVGSTPMTAAEAVSNRPRSSQTPGSKDPKPDDGDRHSALTAWLYGKPSAEKPQPKETRQNLDDETRPSFHRSAESQATETTADGNQAKQAMPVQEPARQGFDMAASREQEAQTQTLPRQDPSNRKSEQPMKQPQQRTKGGQRKHSGRSAVPSWDEILFGD